MSRIRFLAGKPLPILNIGRGDTPVGAGTGGAPTRDMAIATAISPGTSADIVSKLPADTFVLP